MGRIGLGINWKNPNTVYALVTAQKRPGRLLPIRRRRRDVDADRPHGDRTGRPGRRRRWRTATPPAACQPIGASRRPRRRTPSPGRPTRKARRAAAARRRLLSRRRSRLLQRDLRRRERSRDDLVPADDDVGAAGTAARPGATQPLPGVHVDHHEIVVDRADKNHYIIGNDGGLYETYDGVEDLPALHEPAALAVLSRLDRQREAVLQRVRRRAGQRHDLRSVADVEPRRHPHERLDHGRRRRWLRAAHRSGRSEHRLRAVAGRGAPAARPAHGPEREHPAAMRTTRSAARSAASRRSRRGRGAPGRKLDGGGRGGGGGRFGRWQWDSPVIVSPHAARRLYFGGERVYRSDDRGDTWTAISPDLTRQLDAAKIPIMGKVWPPDSVAFNQATSMLSTITTVDESPLLEGPALRRHRRRAIVQVTEDGGKNWRKVEALPGVPENTYVTDVFASPRDSNTVVRHREQLPARRLQAVRAEDARTAAGRGRRSRAICRHASGAWAIVQDHVNPNLLFAGTGVRRVLHRRWRRALGAAQGRDADDTGARPRHPEA